MRNNFLVATATGFLSLFEATEHGEKAGIFSKVTKVQRVDTRDGVKPTEVPSKSIQGKVVPVHYTATYNFYTAN